VNVGGGDDNSDGGTNGLKGKSTAVGTKEGSSQWDEMD
jgi:hypothetical protein